MARILHCQTKKSIPILKECLNLLVNRCEYLDSLENNYTVKTAQTHLTGKHKHRKISIFQV